MLIVFTSLSYDSEVLKRSIANVKVGPPMFWFYLQLKVHEGKSSFSAKFLKRSLLVQNRF